MLTATSPTTLATSPFAPTPVNDDNVCICPVCDRFATVKSLYSVSCVNCGILANSGECEIHGSNCPHLPNQDSEDSVPCSNCKRYGTPCLNCAEYEFHGRLGPGYNADGERMIIIPENEVFECFKHGEKYRNMVAWMKKHPYEYVLDSRDYDWPSDLY